MDLASLIPAWTDTERGKESSPERNLWAWCLYSGVISADDGNAADLAWIWSDEYRVGSFAWICDALGADDEAIRERLRVQRPVRWKQRKVSRWIGL